MKITEKQARERYIKYKDRNPGVSTDSYMDCPNCGRVNAMEKELWYWRCLWFDCLYRMDINKGE